MSRQTLHCVLLPASISVVVVVVVVDILTLSRSFYKHIQVPTSIVRTLLGKDHEELFNSFCKTSRGHTQRTSSQNKTKQNTQFCVGYYVFSLPFKRLNPSYQRRSSFSPGLQEYMPVILYLSPGSATPSLRVLRRVFAASAVATFCKVCLSAWIAFSKNCATRRNDDYLSPKKWNLRWNRLRA